MQLIDPPFKIGTTTISSNKQLLLYSFDDFFLLCDFKVPKSIKITESLKYANKPNWLYVSQPKSQENRITRNKLRDKNKSGDIVAYKYTECILDGINCVYYGYIPTINKTDNFIHYNQKVTCLPCWPRKLYVYLRYSSPCTCSDGCLRVKTINRDNIEIIVCLSKIYWSDVKIILGESDESSKDIMIPPRICSVCANCEKCSAIKCRNHVKCKHKNASV